MDSNGLLKLLDITLRVVDSSELSLRNKNFVDAQLNILNMRYLLRTESGEILKYHSGGNLITHLEVAYEDARDEKYSQDMLEQVKVYLRQTRLSVLSGNVVSGQ